MNNNQSTADKNVIAEPAEEPTSAQATEPPPPPGEMLDSMVSLLRQYLVCDDHQLTVLALWCVHTWCFPCFSTAAYLDVRSPGPQSGKTICLKLLNRLSSCPAFATGASSKTLTDRLLNSGRCLEPEDQDEILQFSPPHTILLDNCHHTFGPSERQPLLALLNSGSDATACYASGDSEYHLFGPKAFSGNAPLPRSLAVRCIPIVLRRRKPSDAVSRFHPAAVKAAAAPLAGWLGLWARSNAVALRQAAQNPPAQLPLNLSPYEQACAEPLLHIAALIGGPWPEKARAAIAAIFNVPDSNLSIQLLSDIRRWFFMKDKPEYLTTSELLSLLAGLDYRPWSAWNAASGRHLAALLHPFGITSNNIDVTTEKVLKGYRFKAFEDAWERYLPSLPGR